MSLESITVFTLVSVIFIPPNARPSQMHTVWVTQISMPGDHKREFFSSGKSKHIIPFRKDFFNIPQTEKENKT